MLTSDMAGSDLRWDKKHRARHFIFKGWAATRMLRKKPVEWHHSLDHMEMMMHDPANLAMRKAAEGRDIPHHNYDLPYTPLVNMEDYVMPDNNPAEFKPATMASAPSGVTMVKLTVGSFAKAVYKTPDGKIDIEFDDDTEVIE